MYRFKTLFIRRSDGKLQVCMRVQSVKCEKTGSYLITTTHGQYRVVGGKSYGGTARDWFCDPLPGAALNGTINVTSVQDAVRLLETC